MHFRHLGIYSFICGRFHCLLSHARPLDANSQPAEEPFGSQRLPTDEGDFGRFAKESFPGKQAKVDTGHQCFSVVAQATPQDSTG